jgi:hypothetical protein
VGSVCRVARRGTPEDKVKIVPDNEDDFVRISARVMGDLELIGWLKLGREVFFESGFIDQLVDIV